MIAIIAILAAILFPVFAAAREKARQSSCASNLKQLSLAVVQYVQDYDESFPMLNNNGFSAGPAPCGSPLVGTLIPSGWNGNFYWSSGGTGQMWMESIYPYVKSTGVYICPSFPVNYYSNGLPWTTYGYNTYLGSDIGMKPEYCEDLYGIILSKINFPDHCVLLGDTARPDYPYFDQGGQGNGQSWGSILG